MKILQRILYVIGALILVILLLILISAVKPELADKLGGLVGKVSDSLPSDNRGDAPDQVSQEGASVSIDEETEGDCIALPVSVPGSGYEAPAEEAVAVPTYVQGLNGYYPITDSGEILDDITAGQVKDRLSVGQTGEGLAFDSTVYPYYAMLDEDGKKLYRQIYANADALNERFSPVVDVLPNGFRNAFTAVMNDHPELFWVESGYTYQFSKKNGIAGITLKFNSTSNNLESAKEVFRNNANSILQMVNQQATDYEKEVFVHDALVQRVTYNLSASMNQSAYSALVNGETVCAGYARAYQYILQQLGIPCYYCMGYAGENHAWNIVKLDQDYYNVDTTWDDTDPVNYFFFNCSDKDYSDTHVRKELSVYLPPCNGGKFSNLLESPGVVADDDATGNGTGSETSNGNGTTSGNGTGTGSEIPNGNGSGATSGSETPNGNGATNGNGNETASGDVTSGNMQSDAFKNTLQDYGLTEADAINTLEDYGLSCYNNLLESNGKAAYFTTVISNKELWDLIYSEYQSGDYKDLYMQSVMEQLEINGCDMSVISEELAGGYYLLRHTFYAR